MEYEIIKVIICAVGGMIITLLMTGCGVTNGSVTLGTTGFLDTVNRGSMRGSLQSPEYHSQHTPEDKRKLNDLVRGY